LLFGHLTALAAQNPPRDVSQAPRPGTAVMRGSVVAADTGAPIRDARLTLSRAGDKQPLAGRTDSQGRFEFTSLLAGEYRLQVNPGSRAARYLPQSYPAVPASGGQRPALSLKDGETLERIAIKLARASAIGGRVVDEYGEPVAFVGVRALLELPAGRGQATGAGSSFLETDDLGRFRIFGLQPGDYVVLAEPRREPAAGEAAAESRLLATYYPATPNPAEAATVKLTPGQDVAEIEIRLARGGAFRVRGTILNSRGEPAAGVSVAAMARKPGGGFSGSGVTSDADGSFTLQNVTPGEHYLTARPRSDPRIAAPGAEFALVPIAVYQDLEGIVVTTKPGATITGRIAFEPEPPSTLPSLQILALGDEALPRPTLRLPMTKPDAEGRFTLEPLFGPVLIRASGATGWWLDRVTFDRTDVTNRLTEFPQGAKLTVVLTREGAGLSGSLTGAAGQPAPEATVVLFGADPAQWNSRFTTTRTVKAVDGNYSLPALKAGRYFVLATPPGDVNLAGADPDYFALLSQHAASIVLGDKEQRTLNLRLVTLPR
jgi:hypothetical protein